MEVILIQDLANLGFKNDIVKVRDGYGPAAAEDRYHRE